VVEAAVGLAAPDKFRGSLDARGVARAIAAGFALAGRAAIELPLADGGEGTLDALGGANRSTRVRGPLGSPVDASWRLADGIAVIETAQASGLSLAGGPAGNDPVGASTSGTGELIAAALAAGASRVVVAVGGSASTDGGLGALDALGRRPFRVPVEVACDVRTPFLDAASVFGPQKGASVADVTELERRLAELAASYRDTFGIDVTTLPGAGAAGGLAGGLAALGATLVPGFDLVASRVGLGSALRGAAIVVTGEGKLDATSFDGKVVGGILAASAEAGIPALVVAGEIESVDCPVPAISLVELFGPRRAFAETAACISEAVAAHLGAV
jgi:glycerate kinase